MKESKKMNLSEMKKLSRSEMKSIMAGGMDLISTDGDYGDCDGKSAGDSCTISSGPCKGSTGTCSNKGKCAAGC